MRVKVAHTSADLSAEYASRWVGCKPRIWDDLAVPGGPSLVNRKRLGCGFEGL